ncbi:calcium-binding protein [Sphingomonas sp. UBA978]|uniref:calcium-binding protein n=1 Tax=unclassified Sphingomonas TaxID=196159 RepID=UPI0025E56A95|nr:calcium-binding protein [Sphingomonas sp. UBA978]
MTSRRISLSSGVVLSIQGTDDRLYVIGQLDGRERIVNFEFADGTTWTAADLRALLYASEQASGSNILQGSYSPDQLSGEAGNDRIYGGGGDDVLSGGAGSDRLDGGSGNDTLAGGTGADRLEGGDGNDIYLFNRGDGSDTIVDFSGSNVVRLGAGIAAADVRLSRALQDGDVGGIVLSIVGTDDRLYITGQLDGPNRIASVEFADGSKWTEADFRVRLFADEQTAGDDVIQGSYASDQLSGADGDDYLYGRGGDDTLTGGAGVDRLEGGSGNDTYVYNRGDGRDAIWDESGDDTLRFGAGITAADLVLSRSLQDGDTRGLVIAIGNTEDRVYLIGAQGAGQAVEHIEFADGTRWTLAELRAHLYEQATTAGADIIRGSGGKDSLYGGAGDDFLYGDDGNDILDGGSGADRLEGGFGDDTYLFGRVDGWDTIVDAGGLDVVRFAPGVLAGDLTVSRSMQDGDDAEIVLAIKGIEDRLYIVGQQNPGSRVESFVFADGTTWAWQTITDLTQANTLGGVIVASTMGDDTITGTMGSDVLRGMGGDEVLRGGMGSDRYIYARGDGNDVIYDAVDSEAVDRLELTGINAADVRVVNSPTDADDIIIEVSDGQTIYLDQQNVAGGGIDQVVFADGIVWNKQQLADRAANAFSAPLAERIVGTNFAETLHGGAGNNVLVGLGGGDTYLFNLGDGADTIDETIVGGSKLAPASTDLDTIRFGAGIAFADLWLAALGTGGDMMLTIAGHSESLLLKGQDLGGANGIELLAFADGSTVAFAALRGAAIGAAITAGDDVVSGFASNDILIGGAGNDMLIGGKGADTYVYARGDGDDTIVETADGATNILAFGADIALTDLRFDRRASAPTDLFITVAGGGRIVVRGQFEGAGGIQQVRFADGVTLSRDDIVRRMLAQPATPGDDFIVGSSSGDTIDGLAGADTIFGMEGDDTIYGGAGNDALHGGVGADTIHGGDGDDVISGEEGIDTLDGGAGFDTVDYGFSLDRWSIDLAAGTATMIGVDKPQVETISGFEAAIGGIGADVLIGDGGANTLRGGSGNDVLRGARGDDIFLVDGDEDGVDTVDGGAGADTILAMSDGTVIALAGVQDVETISGGGHTGVVVSATDGDDTLDLSGVTLQDIQSILMGNGNDILTGSAGADVIDLGAGDDVLRYGATLSAGDDVDGGEGNDRIEATADGTVIHVSRMVGIETVTAAGFANVVVEGSDAADVFDLTKTAYVGVARFELDGGDDTFIGGQGADVVRGGGGDDVLAGNAGDDVFEFDSGNNGHDRIDGGAGVDTLRASADGAVMGIAALAGVEAIDGAGHAGVTISLTETADTLDLSALTVTGIAGIVGGAGDDVIRGSNGADTFLVGISDGSDDIDGGAGIDTIKATADGVTIGLKHLASVEAITADGHVGVTVRTTDAADTLDLSSMTLTGIERITLGAGDDVFVGTGGSDTIEGGAGNDTLTGGYGDDTYLFSLGDGHDTIREGLSGAGGGLDVLRFGRGIRPEDVQVTTANNGADFVFSIGNGSDTVRVINGASASEDYWIDEIRFDDGTIWTRSSLTGAVVPYTNGDDRIYGTNDAETLRAGAGNDWINGRGGNDTIIGGTGNDTLGGGSGNDTYIFNRGDGQDTILDGIDYWDGGNGGNDTIVLGAGILASDVTVSQQANGRDLKLDLGQGDSIYIGNSPLTDGGNVIEQVKFADGTVWTAADLFARSIIPTDGNDALYGDDNSQTLDGGAGNDRIIARGGNDVIIGGLGNDNLSGDGGDDTYIYARGDGADYIQEWSRTSSYGGNDTLRFGAGINPGDVIVTQTNNGRDFMLTIANGGGSVGIYEAITDENSRVETVAFADGTTWNFATLMAKSMTGTSGNDALYGDDNSQTLDGGAGNDRIIARGGNDVIIGGLGNDNLSGDGGDDTYVFAWGDGADYISEWSRTSSYGGNDTLRFEAGINPADVIVTQANNGRDFILTVSNGGGSVGMYEAITNGNSRVETVAFADGTTWDFATLMAKSTLASPDPVWINGDAGANSLFGTDTADTFQGNGGADYLAGGKGSDTYRYASGDGSDQIDEWGTAGDTDVLKLLNITSPQVALRRDGIQLYVKDIATGAEIRVENQFYSDATYGIERIVFSDGTSWNREAIQQAAVLMGDANDNQMYGYDTADTFQGNGGADYLAGGKVAIPIATPRATAVIRSMNGARPSTQTCSSF